MIKRLILPATFAALALGLAACSEKTESSVGNATDSIATDVNATMGEAVDDVDAAADRAFGAAENAADHAGNTIDDATRATGRAISNAGNEIAH